MGNHSSGTLFCSAQIQGGKNAAAFRFGQRAQVLAGISQQQDSRHAFRIFGGEVADDADNDVGLVLAVGTIDRNQAAFGIEIVLDETRREEIRRASLPAQA